ncbi:MAG: hypothetical protein H6Q07_266, partial [Acidobacteria bacterium]|nr:hypothetical protein [Acidobacteriota bacterium]
MRDAKRLAGTVLLFSVSLLTINGFAQTPMTLTKAAVGEKIRRVEDGVDEFRKYLERKGENARTAADSSQ